MSASIAFAQKLPAADFWMELIWFFDEIRERSQDGQPWPNFPDLNGATHLICVNRSLSRHSEAAADPSAVRFGFFLYSCQFVSIRGFSLCLC